MTLVTRQPEPNPAYSEQQILEALGIKTNDPKAQASILLCQRFNLDPFLKHLVLIKGNPYITRDGLLDVAHRSGVFDGIEVLEMAETSTHFTARVSVWRKDMTRPFTYPGRYPKNGSNKEFAPEMALKVAEVMALRRAFRVAAPAAEERWDLEPEGKTGKASDVSTLEVTQLPTPLEQVNSVLKNLEQGGSLERKEMRTFMAFVIGDDALNARGVNPTEAQCAVFLDSLVVDGSLDTAAIDAALAEFGKAKS